MIIGCPTTPFETIRKLTFTDYKFYLSGSRFFGHAHPESDWDFFVQSDGDRLHIFLKKHGFKRLQMNPDWFDDLCEAIFHHDSGVHIACVVNSDMKKRAQQYILNSNLLSELKQADKDLRRKIWNEAYTTITTT